MPSRIDVHAHYFPADFIDLMRRHGQDVSLGEDPLGGAAGMDQRLRMMDDAGIEFQVLSVAPLFPCLADQTASVEAARVANDGLAAVVTARPDRFKAFAVLPLPQIDQLVAELERALAHPGFVGAAVGTSLGGRPMRGDFFDATIMELDRRGSVLFFHPVGVATRCVEGYERLAWLVGAPFEDTLTAVDLLLDGIPAKYPHAKIVIPHLGGALPFLLRRIDDQWLRRAPAGTAPPSALAARLWVDTVNSTPGALELAVHALGPDRIMLGTDFPYLPGDMFTVAVEYVGQAALPEAMVTSIEHAAARRLLAAPDPAPQAGSGTSAVA
jgi:6-methylsalicylate decarboxylase